MVDKLQQRASRNRGHVPGLTHRDGERLEQSGLAMNYTAYSITDDLIELHKRMVRTGSNLDSTLNEVLKEGNDRLVQQRKFATAVDAIQRDLVKNLETSRTESRSFFAQLMQSFDSKIQLIFGKVTAAIDTVKEDVEGLGRVQFPACLV